MSRKEPRASRGFQLQEQSLERPISRHFDITSKSGTEPMTYVTGHNSLAAKNPPNSLHYDGKLVIVVSAPTRWACGRRRGFAALEEDLLRSSHGFRECHAGS